MKFRKKPIVVEAFQMTQKRRWDNSEWPEWLHRAWNEDSDVGSLYINESDSTRTELCIGTPEGPHTISWDDWIIQGVRGELYLWKPDAFEATYEPVDD